MLNLLATNTNNCSQNTEGLISKSYGSIFWLQLEHQSLLIYYFFHYVYHPYKQCSHQIPIARYLYWEINRSQPTQKYRSLMMAIWVSLDLIPQLFGWWRGGRDKLSHSSIERPSDGTQRWSESWLTHTRFNRTVI